MVRRVRRDNRLAFNDVYWRLFLPVAQMNPSTDDFAALLEESFAGSSMIEGRVVPATVTSIGGDFITVDVGLKTEGRIPLREFASDEKQPAMGEIVEVYLERIENALGDAVLSRDKARREEAWTRLERVHEKKETVKGSIVGRVKGGFTLTSAASTPSCRVPRSTSVQSATSAR